MSEPSTARRDAVVTVTRVVAYAAAVAGAVAFFPALAGEAGGTAVFVAFGAFAIAGAALAMRLLPPSSLRGVPDRAGDAAVQFFRVQRTLVDLLVVVLVSLAGGFVATTILEGPAIQLSGVPLLLQLVMLAAIFCGAAVGLLIVPFVIIAALIVRRARG